jgi:hypothetical protein
MRYGGSGESIAGVDALTGSAAQVGEWLLYAGAGFGMALYVGSLLVGSVDLATLGVVVGVCGAVGNLLLRTVRASVGDAVG